MRTWAKWPRPRLPQKVARLTNHKQMLQLLSPRKQVTNNHHSLVWPERAIAKTLLHSTKSIGHKSHKWALVWWAKTRLVAQNKALNLSQRQPHPSISKSQKRPNYFVPRGSEAFPTAQMCLLLHVKKETTKLRRKWDHSLVAFNQSNITRRIRNQRTNEHFQKYHC